MSISDKLTTIAENQQKVYNSGVNKGKKDVTSNPSAYMTPEDYIIRFNEVRNNSYVYAFSGHFWGGTIIEPRISIKEVTNGHGMFKYSGIKSLNVDYPSDGGVGVGHVNFSKATYPNQAFRYSSIKEMGELVFEKALQMSATFGDMSSLHTIKKLTLPNHKVQYHLTFDNTPNLKNITLTPNRIMSSISFATNSQLTKESIQSIIGALSDSASSQIVYISSSAVNREFRTGSSGNGSTSTEWNTLVATKPNWTIVLSNSSGLV